MAKKKKWWEIEHERCEAFRAEHGLKAGDGLRRLTAMKSGTAAERATAQHLEECARKGFWSVEHLDITIALYATNPLMSLLLGGRTHALDRGNVVDFDPLKNAAHDWAKTSPYTKKVEK